MEASTSLSCAESTGSRARFLVARTRRHQSGRRSLELVHGRIDPTPSGGEPLPHAHYLALEMVGREQTTYQHPHERLKDGAAGSLIEASVGRLRAGQTDESGNNSRDCKAHTRGHRDYFFLQSGPDRLELLSNCSRSDPGARPQKPPSLEGLLLQCTYYHRGIEVQSAAGVLLGRRRLANTRSPSQPEALDASPLTLDISVVPGQPHVTTSE